MKTTGSVELKESSLKTMATGKQAMGPQSTNNPDAPLVDNAPSDEDDGVKTTTTQTARKVWQVRDGFAQPMNGSAKLTWETKKFSRSNSTVMRKKTDDLGTSWHVTSSFGERGQVKASRRNSLPKKTGTNDGDHHDELRSAHVLQHRDGHATAARNGKSAPEEATMTPQLARKKFLAMVQSSGAATHTPPNLFSPRSYNRRLAMAESGPVASSVVRGTRVFNIALSSVPRISSDDDHSGSIQSPGGSHTAEHSSEIPETQRVEDDVDFDSFSSNSEAESGAMSLNAKKTTTTSSKQYIGAIENSKSKTRMENLRWVPLNDTCNSNGSLQRRKVQSEPGEIDSDLEDVEGFDDEDFVVDKLPKRQRSTARNLRNFPIWPPTINVKSWQKREGNMSDISLGSGFTNDFLCESFLGCASSLSDDITYLTEDFGQRPPGIRTSYRIRYDGPSTARPKKNMVNSDDRFAENAGNGNLPSRLAPDAAPVAPPRRSISSVSDGDKSICLEEELANGKASLPDVWVTALSGTAPLDAVWKVRRVWADESQDLCEQDHNVHHESLLSRIKQLVGAPGSPSSSDTDNAPKMPQRHWHVQTVSERRGRIVEVEDEKTLDETELKFDMQEMAERAVKEIEKNQKAFEEYKKEIEQRNVIGYIARDLDIPFHSGHGTEASIPSITAASRHLQMEMATDLESSDDEHRPEKDEVDLSPTANQRATSKSSPKSPRRPRSSSFGNSSLGVAGGGPGKTKISKKKSFDTSPKMPRSPRRGIEIKGETPPAPSVRRGKKSDKRQTSAQQAGNESHDKYSSSFSSNTSCTVASSPSGLERKKRKPKKVASGLMNLKGASTATLIARKVVIPMSQHRVRDDESSSDDEDLESFGQNIKSDSDSASISDDESYQGGKGKRAPRKGKSREASKKSRKKPQTL